MGYATQDPAVYGDLTLAENLRYFGTVLGMSRSHLADAIARTVATLDLSGLEGRLVGTFSGGQLARADLAVALLAKPDLLVLDEPTVGLDPVLRRDLWAMFHRLAADGASLLVSSHVMDEAARCDHLLFMREGRFLAAASPDEMLAATGAARPGIGVPRAGRPPPGGPAMTAFTAGTGGAQSGGGSPGPRPAGSSPSCGTIRGPS